MSGLPDLRLTLANNAPVNSRGEFVLYWMTAARRVRWNFALERAAAWARDLRRPLVILEDLRSGRRWDSDRRHRFALDGMADTARRLRGRGVLYYPYVEPSAGAADGLLAALAARASVVVADEFPCGTWPQVVKDAAAASPVRLEKVDSCGLLPLLAADRTFTTAFSFRAFLQKHLPAHLAEFPQADPLAGLRLPRLKALPAEIVRRWPPASADLLAGKPAALAALPIDHAVPPAEARGGAAAAEKTLRRFLDERLGRYVAGRNHPDDEATSDLAPYLHFGHISAHQVFAELMDREGWSAERLAARSRGRRAGWWGVGPNAEAFLDQLITWREVGYNACARRADCDRYGSLPAWARQTLADHAGDPRPSLYVPAEFEAAATHDSLWNAAQTQLVRTGRLHNYLRMLWGKKILEWTPSPEAALDVMIELNNKYALDGCDPNSISGIFWVLGRYDRAWGPERKVFGKIRFMSSEATRRKVRLKKYLGAFAAGGGGEEDA